MKKLLLPVIIIATSMKIHAQVGVNTSTPAATLDVVGKPGEQTVPDGFIAPRLTRAQIIAKTIYSSNQQGAIVYVTDASGTTNAATAKVTGAGYYYFDGTVWQAIGGTPVVPTEPWNIQGSNTAATANGQNIYQNGNVALGSLATDPARTEKLYVKGSTMLDAQNFAGTRAGILNMNDSSYYNSIYEKPANSNNGESQAKSRTYNMLNYYNTDSAPVAEIFSGNDTHKAGGKISMFSSSAQKASGLGWVDLYAYSYTSAAAGKNTYLGLDDDGVKIGTMRAISNDLQYDGTNGISTTSNSGLVTDTYALPKVMPTAGQVLMYDTESGGGTSAKVVKTKWATPASGASSIWNVQATTIAASTLTDNVYHTGKVAIGTGAGDAVSASSLFVKGNIETTGNVITSSSNYADYVFEKYFTGNSTINAKYNFTPLSVVKDFVAKNHHLPGVTPIDEITKTANGYKVDLTTLSMQQLEKLEELYLHVIEQKETIDTQKKEIEKQNDRIKALEDKLEKLTK